MADTNSNLKASFQQGFNVFKRIETDENPGNSKKFQDNVCEAINCLRRTVEMVNELALFSMNEELDDISTNNIRYLLLPALLGELHLKLCTGERIDVVGISKVYLLDFLERCKTYGLLQQDVNLQQSSEVSLARNQRSLEDLASERQAKITRYKKLKEQEKQLQDISKVLEDSSVLSHDEELELLHHNSLLRGGLETQQKSLFYVFVHVDANLCRRKYNILLLENWINKALEHLSSINSELQILEHIEKLKRQGQDREHTKNTDKATSDEKTNNKKLLAKPILITRQIMQSKVFGAGYPSLPTMTQEECFEKELREGKIVAEFRDKLTTKTESENEKDEEGIDSCEDEKYLEKLKKDREWDDWKDDHRRGWGNRENMG